MVFLITKSPEGAVTKVMVGREAGVCLAELGCSSRGPCVEDGSRFPYQPLRRWCQAPDDAHNENSEP